MGKDTFDQQLQWFETMQALVTLMSKACQADSNNQRVRALGHCRKLTKKLYRDQFGKVDQGATSAINSLYLQLELDEIPTPPKVPMPRMCD